MADIYQDAVNRVQRGATVLDNKIPGWYNYIDTQLLSIESPQCCILGQLNTTVFEGKKDFLSLAEEVVGDTYEGTRKHGFCPYFAYGLPIEGDNILLTELWIDAIKERVRAEQDADIEGYEYTAEIQSESVHGTPQPEVFDSELCLV